METVAGLRYSLCDISLAYTSIFFLPSELPRPDLFALIREGAVGLGSQWPQGFFSAKHVGSVGASAWKKVSCRNILTQQMPESEAAQQNTRWTNGNGGRRKHYLLNDPVTLCAQPGLCCPLLQRGSCSSYANIYWPHWNTWQRWSGWQTAKAWFPRLPYL